MGFIAILTAIPINKLFLLINYSN